MFVSHKIRFYKNILANFNLEKSLQNESRHFVNPESPSSGASVELNIDSGDVEARFEACSYSFPSGTEAHAINTSCSIAAQIFQL
jgi:hypothetical protein